MISYTIVARGSTIIADYSPDGTNLEREMQKLIEQPFVRGEQRRMNHYYFTFYKGNSVNFICATGQDVEKSILIKYLENLSNKWSKMFGDLTSSIGPHSLTSQSKPLFEQAMAECKISATDLIRHDLDQTQKLMSDTLTNAVIRGEQLQNLSLKSEDLVSTSNEFQQQSKKLRQKMYCSHLKTQALTIAFIIFLLYVLLSFFCGGLRLKKCINK